MKKFGMLTLTLIVIFLTSITYAYENNIVVPEIKQPGINLSSSKFGEIKNIKLISKYLNPGDAVLILSKKEEGNLIYSCLYYMKIETGEYKLLSQTPAHKYLDAVILYDVAFSNNNIITAYDEGIIRTTLTYNSENEVVSENIKVPITM